MAEVILKAWFKSVFAFLFVEETTQEDLDKALAPYQSYTQRLVDVLLECVNANRSVFKSDDPSEWLGVLEYTRQRYNLARCVLEVETVSLRLMEDMAHKRVPILQVKESLVKQFDIISKQHITWENEDSLRYSCETFCTCLLRLFQEQVVHVEHDPAAYIIVQTVFALVKNIIVDWVLLLRRHSMVIDTFFNVFTSVETAATSYTAYLREPYKTMFATLNVEKVCLETPQCPSPSPHNSTP